MNNTNHVEVVGTIITAPTYSHEYNGIKFYSTRLNVLRHKSTKFDYIHAFVPADLISIDGRFLEEGDRIAITGSLVNSNLCQLVDISISADKVELTDADDRNDFTITGKIYRMLDTSKVANSSKIVKSLIIKHEGENSNVTIKCAFWNNLARLIESDYEIDQEVLVKGRLFSHDKLATNTHGEEVNITLHETAANIIKPIN